MSAVSCSICWDIVTPTCVASYVLCGHVYHHNCLNKWLKTSSTCPECRNIVVIPKRIYLNLVPDPEIEDLNLELAKKNKEYEFLQTSNEIQDAIIKQLDKEMSTKLMEKNEELLFSQARNAKLQVTSSNVEYQNQKLKLELEMQEKQQDCLRNEVTDLKSQLVASQSKNTEITNSTAVLKEFYREQVKQISDLHSEILSLTERLDQFRGLYVSANTKLQVQLQEHEIVKNERDALLNRNSQLVKSIYNLKLQLDNKILHKIKKKYNRLPLSAGTFLSKKRRQVDCVEHKLKEKSVLHLTKKWNCVRNNDLKIKLVKSKIRWVCVKS